MRRIAIYGKGGIGKSTVSSNLTAALSDKGVKVLQIGCDPKHDSVRLLTHGNYRGTVLDHLRDKNSSIERLEDVIMEGYKGALCTEAGGPEPGIGCAGRGIISAFDLLNDLGVNSLPIDMILYDVLGDVVCGGFAVPMRNEYADTIYIVTSGEFMAIYAANNILRGMNNYDKMRVGGIIFNSRGEEGEYARVRNFSEAVGIPIIAVIPRSKLFLDAEEKCMTVVESSPDSNVSSIFRDLAEHVITGKKHEAVYLSESELEKVVLGREVVYESNKRHEAIHKDLKKDTSVHARRAKRAEIVYGCAFIGAVAATLTVRGLTTVMHSPKSCAQYASQHAGNSARRSYLSELKPIIGYLDSDSSCTCMDENSVIFGGVDQLRACMNEAILQGSDKIAVVTSCASGVIGDDVLKVVSQIRFENKNVKITLIDADGNINGDHMRGLSDANLAMARDHIIRTDRRTRTVNLVGLKPLATNERKNIETITSILSDMDLKINCTFMCDCSVSDIERMQEAEISIPMNRDSFTSELMNFFTDEYSMQFTSESFGTGISSVERLISEIGRRMNADAGAKKAIASIRKEHDERVAKIMPFFKGKTACILSIHGNISWLVELLNDLGVKVQKTVAIERPESYMSLKNEVLPPSAEVVSDDQFSSVVSEISEIDPDMLFTSYPIDEKKGKFVFRIPMLPDAGPYAGVDMLSSWSRSIMAPTVEGWRKDVIQ